MDGRSNKSYSASCLILVQLRMDLMYNTQICSQAKTLGLIWSLTAISVLSLQIIEPGDVVVGRPFTLQCIINTEAGEAWMWLVWSYSANNNAGRVQRIYSSDNCTSSIQLSATSPPGLSGGCQVINGQEVYTVTIQNVTEDLDRSKWLCNYGTKSNVATLDVKVRVERVTLTDPPDAVLDGDSINFSCVTSPSKPQACINWYIQRPGNITKINQGEPDCDQTSTSVSPTTRTLRFTPRAEENGANLYCTANNSVTDPPVRSQIYTLNVQYRPNSPLSVTGYNNNTPITSGESVTLNCQVGKGNPRPVLSWSQDCGSPSNTVTDKDGRLQISASITGNRSLNQKSCVCLGNQVGSLTGWRDETKITFNVTFGPVEMLLRADIGQSGDRVSVTENSTVTFTCTSTESNPAVDLFWFNTTSSVPATELSPVNTRSGPNHGYVSTQQYTVRVGRYQDGKVIRCVGRSRGNEKLEANLRLEILDSPQITCNRTRITVFEGQRVVISCDIKSKLMVNITWLKDGELVRQGDLYRLNLQQSVDDSAKISSLIIESVDKEHAGVYVVEAGNAIGSRRHDICLHVLENQFIPNELLVFCCDNQVFLSWASGIDSSLVEYFKLEYRWSDSTWTGVLVRNPGRVKLVKTTVDGLVVGQKYDFRLQPNTDVALSDYALANCTVQGSLPIEDDQRDKNHSITTAGVGVGVVIGTALVIIPLTVVIWWLMRRGNLTWHRGAADKGETFRSDSQKMEFQPTVTSENPTTGPYEDLDTRGSTGPHYEELTNNIPPPVEDGRVYQNATAL